MPERRVVQQLLPPALRHREDAAAATALHRLVGLDRQAQPVPIALRGQNPYAGHTEHHRAVGQPSLSPRRRRLNVSLLGRC